jgi:hypothetical protein
MEFVSVIHRYLRRTFPSYECLTHHSNVADGGLAAWYLSNLGPDAGFGVAGFFVQGSQFG